MTGDNFLLPLGMSNEKQNKMNDYRIAEFNNGTLFAVVDDYNMYGKYYKTRKGAEKHLKSVLTSAGLI